MNTTLDGFCDHTYGVADDDLHQHYQELLQNAGVVLYGRVTYQLMEYWRTVLENPTGNKAMDEFAVAMDEVPKIVFSRTLMNLDWSTARLAERDLKEEVLYLREQPGKDVFVGSPSLIDALAQMDLFDEYQLCIHPVVAGAGLRLFKSVSEKFVLKLLNTKIFSSGAIVLYYQPNRSQQQ